MNCFFGTSNGSVENVIVDDKNTSEVHIALAVYGRYIYWFTVTSSNQDYLQINSQLYDFTKLYTPTVYYNAVVGWQTYTVTKVEKVFTFQFNFFDNATLVKWCGQDILDGKIARRILGRFLPNCSLDLPKWNEITKQWQTKSIQICDV